MSDAVIIGYGSIGIKHHQVLKKLNCFDNIYILSRREFRRKHFYKSWSDIKQLSPKYFVISNESNNHLKTFNLINNTFENVKIYIEKPIFLGTIHPKLKNNNSAIIGYNMRQHPAISKTLKLINSLNIYKIDAKCVSYLPLWRKKSYTKTHSASKYKCGGIVYELSHELDYLNYLFKNLKITNSQFSKLSDLKLNYEDNFYGEFKSSKCKHITLTLNYYDLIPERILKIYSSNKTIKIDFIKNIIIIKSLKNMSTFKINYNLNKSYLDTHQKFLNNEYSSLCRFDQGLNLLKVINKIYSNSYRKND